MPSKGAANPARRSMDEDGQVQRRRGTSFRKQIRAFFWSPVRLVRRYVFLQRPPRPPKPTLEDSAQDPFVRGTLEAARRRNLVVHLTFIGLSQSGKSTTISKLFNGERPKAEGTTERQFKIYKNAGVGQDIGLSIVDTPGLLGKNTVEQDVEIMLALSTFLKRELPSRIPAVTFIVARLDDNRFEGEQSDFSRMLKTVYLARKHLTDQRNSNMVLLLTHAEKAEVSQDDINYKILRYKDAFCKVFSKSEDVPVIAIDNIREHGKSIEDPKQRYHNIIFEGLTQLATKRRDHCLHELVKWFVGKSKRFSISFMQNTVSVSALLPPRRALVNKGVANLLDDRVNEDALDSEDSDNDEETPCYEPYFVLYHSPNQRVKRSSRKGKKSDVAPEKNLTCIPSGSHIVLANRHVISIENCLVGDKLLSLEPNRPSIITAIRVASFNDPELQNCSVGSVYCAVKQDLTSAPETTQTGRYIYMYQNSSFRLINASKANVPEKTTTRNLYFIELDSDKGTLIVNGFPCFAKLDHAIEK